MSVVLETKRLLLREMSIDDLDFIAGMMADPEVMEFYPQCYSRSDSESWIGRVRKPYAEDGHALWLTVDKNSRNPIGQVGLVQQMIDETVETEEGYMLERKNWNRGFATEAATAARDFAFQTLGKSKVISLIRPSNVPSQRVAIRLGMLPENTTYYAGTKHLIF